MKKAAPASRAASATHRRCSAPGDAFLQRHRQEPARDGQAHDRIRAVGASLERECFLSLTHTAKRLNEIEKRWLSLFFREAKGRQSAAPASSAGLNGRQSLAVGAH